MTVQELMRTDEGREQMAALAEKAEQLELYSEIGLFLAAGESVERALKELINIVTRHEKTGDPGDAMMQRLAARSVTFAREWQQQAYDALVTAINLAQLSQQENPPCSACL